MFDPTWMCSNGGRSFSSLPTALASRCNFWLSIRLKMKETEPSFNQTPLKGIFPREQQTPEALDAHQKAEIEKWWPIIKAAGIKAE